MLSFEGTEGLEFGVDVRGRHFLVMNPDWDVREEVETHASAVADALGLATRDVRGRLLKPGATLMSWDTDPAKIESSRAALVQARYPCVVVTEGELREVERPARAVAIRREGDAIDLLDRDDMVAMRIDSSSRLLVVVGDLETRRDVTVRSLLHNERVSVQRRLASFISGKTLIRLFDASGGQGVFIRDRGFRFPSLGEEAGLSSTRNCRLLLDVLVGAAGEASLDVDFGLADELPVNVRPPVPEASDALLRFERHCLTSFAMWRGGLIGPAGADDWKEPEHRGPNTGRAIAVTGIPEDRGAFEFLGFGPRLKTALDRVGPRWMSLALLGVAVVGLLGLRATANPLWLGISGMATGVTFLLYGFGSFKRKRLVEDYPISRVRSLAMGRVELSGTAVPRVPMMSPYGDVDCVYFRYRLQQMTRSARGATRWITVASGSSGAIPFGIEDDTGEVLVMPQGARMDLPSSRTVPISPGGSLDRIRAVEECIPAYSSICVLGTARPLQATSPDHRRELAIRLRALKRDKEELAAYDANGDGRIDEAEWAAAVADVRAKVLDERIEGRGEAADTVVIGRGDPDSLFMIWEGDEARLLRGLAASVWTGMVVGGILFTGGLMLLVA